MLATALELGSVSDWQDIYGNGTLAGIVDDPARSLAVPEPGGWVLAITLAVCTLRRSP